MESIIISTSCVLLGLEVLLLWKYQRDELRGCRESYLTCLEEVARAAEITQRTCFASLDELRNRLETLSSRTASAELRSSDGGEPADLDGKARAQSAVSICTADASISTDDVSSCADDVSISTDDVSVRQPDVTAVSPASQADSLQDQQASAGKEKDAAILQREREPAKLARRSLKKKPARREVRKPIGSLVPMDGVVRYGTSAARPAMAVKV